VAISLRATEGWTVQADRQSAALRSRWQLTCKRAIDIIVSLVVLLLALPVLVIAAIAIKLDDRGPVFFTQTRVGRGGKPIRIHKLRTMVVGAEERLEEVLHLNERAGPLFKIEADPRLTRVGAILRATSIDELPQLLDVLTGRMSLVGPRPALPREVVHFDDDLWARVLVQPGVTGLWQIEARDDGSFDAYRRLDLEFVQHWTLWMDLKILFKTVPAVLWRSIRSLFTHRPRAPRPYAAAAAEPERVDERAAL